jgi:hypothetical protein
MAFVNSRSLLAVLLAGSLGVTSLGPVQAAPLPIGRGEASMAELPLEEVRAKRRVVRRNNNNAAAAAIIGLGIVGLGVAAAAASQRRQRGYYVEDYGYQPRGYYAPAYGYRQPRYRTYHEPAPVYVQPGYGWQRPRPDYYYVPRQQEVPQDTRSGRFND